MKNLFKKLAAVLVMVFIFSIMFSLVCSASYSISSEDVSTHPGYIVDHLFVGIDPVYCIDRTVDFSSIASYNESSIPIDSAIKFVLNNSYPVLNTDQIKLLWNITDSLTEAQAYDATQLAIWYLQESAPSDAMDVLITQLGTSGGAYNLYTALITNAKTNNYKEYQPNTKRFEIKQALGFSSPSYYSPAISPTKLKYGPFKYELDVEDVALKTRLSLTLTIKATLPTGVTVHSAVNGSEIPANAIPLDTEFYIQYDPYAVTAPFNYSFTLNDTGILPYLGEAKPLESPQVDDGGSVSQPVVYPIAANAETNTFNSTVSATSPPTITISKTGIAGEEFIIDIYALNASNAVVGKLLNQSISTTTSAEFALNAVVANYASAGATQILIVEKWANGSSANIYSKGSVYSSRTTSFSGGGTARWYNPYDGELITPNIYSSSSLTGSYPAMVYDIDNLPNSIIVSNSQTLKNTPNVSVGKVAEGFTPLLPFNFSLYIKKNSSAAYELIEENFPITAGAAAESITEKIKNYLNSHYPNGIDVTDVTFVLIENYAYQKYVPANPSSSILEKPRQSTDITGAIAAKYFSDYDLDGKTITGGNGQDETNKYPAVSFNLSSVGTATATFTNKQSTIPYEIVLKKELGNYGLNYDSLSFDFYLYAYKSTGSPNKYTPVPASTTSLSNQITLSSSNSFEEDITNWIIAYLDGIPNKADYFILTEDYAYEEKYTAKGYEKLYSDVVVEGSTAITSQSQYYNMYTGLSSSLLKADITNPDTTTHKYPAVEFYIPNSNDKVTITFTNYHEVNPFKLDVTKSSSGTSAENGSFYLYARTGTGTYTYTSLINDGSSNPQATPVTKGLNNFADFTTAINTYIKDHSISDISSVTFVLVEAYETKNGFDTDGYHKKTTAINKSSDVYYYKTLDLRSTTDIGRQTSADIANGYVYPAYEFTFDSLTNPTAVSVTFTNNDTVYALDLVKSVTVESGASEDVTPYKFDLYYWNTTTSAYTKITNGTTIKIELTSPSALTDYLFKSGGVIDKYLGTNSGAFDPTSVTYLLVETNFPYTALTSNDEDNYGKKTSSTPSGFVSAPSSGYIASTVPVTGDVTFKTAANGDLYAIKFTAQTKGVSASANPKITVTNTYTYQYIEPYVSPTTSTLNVSKTWTAGGSGTPTFRLYTVSGNTLTHIRSGAISSFTDLTPGTQYIIVEEWANTGTTSTGTNFKTTSVSGTGVTAQYITGTLPTSGSGTVTIAANNTGLADYYVGAQFNAPAAGSSITVSFTNNANEVLTVNVKKIYKDINGANKSGTFGFDYAVTSNNATDSSNNATSSSLSGVIANDTTGQNFKLNTVKNSTVVFTLTETGFTLGSQPSVTEYLQPDGTWKTVAQQSDAEDKCIGVMRIKTITNETKFLVSGASSATPTSVISTGSPEVEITINSATTQPVTVTVTNTETEGIKYIYYDPKVTPPTNGNDTAAYFIISKADAKTSAVLKGSALMGLEFEIYPYGNSTSIATVTFNDTNYNKLTGKFINHLIGNDIYIFNICEIEGLSSPTDEGKFIILGLEEGHYYIKETGANEGYSTVEATVYHGANDVTTQFELLKTGNTSSAVNNTVYEPKKLSLKNYPLISLTITKTSKDKPAVFLPGAKFQLWTEKASPTSMAYTFDTSVNATKTSLDSGTYYLYETQAPAGTQEADGIPLYIGKVTVDVKTGTITFVSDGSFVEADLSVSPSYILTVKNTRIGGIDIYKYNTKGNFLKGAELSVYKQVPGYNKTQYLAGETPVKSFTSNNAAETLRDLAYGDYVIIETAAPLGYKVRDDVIPFTVSDSTGSKLAVINFADHESVGSLTLNKVDFANRNTKLSGATFEVFYKFPNGWMSIGTMTDGRNGTYTKSNLPIGEYRVTEIQPPYGYNLNNNNTYYFTITANGEQATLINTLSGNTITNVKSVGSLTLSKVDFANHNTRLSGATFEVFYKLPDGWASVGTMADNGNGTYTKGNLPIGEYRVDETKAPDGYDLDSDNKYYFKIAVDGELATIDTALGNNTITNVKTPVVTPLENGSLTLNKVDYANHNTRLPGAVFDVFYKLPDGWVSVGTMTDNGDGTYTKGDLPIGEYCVVETKAPDGYNLDSNNTYYFTIALNDEIATLETALGNNTITNARKPGNSGGSGGGDGGGGRRPPTTEKIILPPPTDDVTPPPPPTDDVTPPPPTDDVTPPPPPEDGTVHIPHIDDQIVIVPRENGIYDLIAENGTVTHLIPYGNDFIVVDDDGIPVGIWRYDPETEEWFYDSEDIPLSEWIYDFENGVWITKAEESMKETPQNPELPQTGGISGIMSVLIGICLLGVGIALNKKKNVRDNSL